MSKKVKIAFQGEKGAYSHLAILEIYPEAEAKACATFDEVLDSNIVKVQVNDVLTKNNFLGAKDFFRTKKDLNNDKIYHHCGIYIFTRDALSRYVNLPRSKLEIERSLEQMRAMENNITIKVSLSDSRPLGIDTKEDLKKVALEMS